MLVLKRKVSEIVVITLEDGRRIEVMLIEAQGGYNAGARLGITAPPTIAVHRREVQDMLDRQAAIVAAGDSARLAGQVVKN